MDEHDTIVPKPAVSAKPPEPAWAPPSYPPPASPGQAPPAPAAATNPPMPATATNPPMPATATNPPMPATATNPPIPAAPAPRASSDDLAHRWEAVQAGFVDDPKHAVEEADRLLGEVVQRLTEERARMRAQWSGASSTSTEDLRVVLQHYRDMIQGLSRRS